ncbi:uncharacterized protein DS421_20g694990 [Arachis hypogaea]|nr:uncharacterized protein DS421_20g694990 [Arachis hypogaea]
MVIGPLLQPVFNTSAAGVLNVTNEYEKAMESYNAAEAGGEKGEGEGEQEEG